MTPRDPVVRRVIAKLKRKEVVVGVEAVLAYAAAHDDDAFGDDDLAAAWADPTAGARHTVARDDLEAARRCRTLGEILSCPRPGVRSVARRSLNPRAARRGSG